MDDARQSVVTRAVERYVVAKDEFESAKDELKHVMTSYSLDKAQVGPYTAHNRAEKRRTIDPIMLLGMGVTPDVVAESATGVNKKRLLERGVDPETIADCETETSFTKCYVTSKTDK